MKKMTLATILAGVVMPLVVILTMGLLTTYAAGESYTDAMGGAAVQLYGAGAVSGLMEPAAFTVCVVDEANLGVDSIQAAAILAEDWGVTVTTDCAQPDVLVTIVNPGYNLDHWVADGWIYEIGGPVWINSQALDISPFNFRCVLDHEIGHHFGLQHVKTASVMTIYGRYLPTVDDKAQLVEAMG